MAFSPWGYATLTFLNLLVDLDDGAFPALVTIDRYLNAGIKKDPKHTRANDADTEKDKMLRSIAKEIKVKGIPPAEFEIDGETIQRKSIQRVFVGKGTPDQVRTTLRLAVRLGHTTRELLQSYADRFTGLDCNGFAGNYWGIDPTTSIDGYDKHRRSGAADIATGDALIFYVDGGTKPYHIGLVETAKPSGDKLALVVTQSAGLENGITCDDFGEVTLKKNGQKHLYFRRGTKSTVYIAQGPPKQ